MQTDFSEYSQNQKAKARIQKPQGGANFWCKSSGVRGGIVMDEIDTCIEHCKGSFEVYHISCTYTNVVLSVNKL